jgi:hypothetical protein
MLQKKRFGDDCAGTSRSHDLDDRDDQVSHQDEPIAHAANNGRLADSDVVLPVFRLEAGPK